MDPTGIDYGSLRQLAISYPERSDKSLDVKTFIGIVPRLVSQLDPTQSALSQLSLIDYPEGPVSEQRLKESLVSQNPRLADRVNRLLELSSNMLAYPDAVVLASWNEPKASEAFKHTQLHMAEGRQRIWFSVSNLDRRTLESHVPPKSTSRALGMCSLCRLEEGATKHIPMIDFRCSSGAEAFERSLELIRGLLLKIGETAGAIFNSGASFHYYGLRLLSDAEWQHFLGRCLLLAPLTDTRYIGHRLIEGFGVLRIAPSRWKPYSPYLVAVL